MINADTIAAHDDVSGDVSNVDGGMLSGLTGFSEQASGVGGAEVAPEEEGQQMMVGEASGVMVPSLSALEEPS